MVNQVELTIVRPTGAMEVVIHPTLSFISKCQFEQIQRETKAADRGHVLSYRILRDGKEVVFATIADIKANKGNYERGLNESMVNQSTKSIEDMSAGGEHLPD